MDHLEALIKALGAVTAANAFMDDLGEAVEILNERIEAQTKQAVEDAASDAGV